MYQFPIADKRISMLTGARKNRLGYKFPCISDNAKKLAKMGYAEYAKGMYLNTNLNSPINSARISQYYPKFPLLKTWQKEALSRIVNSPYSGAVLLMSMGLGKGATAIASAEVLCNIAENVLIVCQKTNIYMWQKELEKWSIPENKIQYKIIHYEGLLKSAEYLSFNWNMVIVDEGIFVSNRDAKRTVAVKSLKAEFKLILTGNPIRKYYDDLWSLLNIVAPDVFTSYWQFTQRFTMLDETPFGISIIGNRDENPNDVFPEFIFVYNKAVVMPEAIDYEFFDIEVELTAEQRKAYTEMQTKYITELESLNEPLTATIKLAMLTKLNQITSSLANFEVLTPFYKNSAKLSYLVEMIKANEIEFPCIIWCSYRNTAEEITGMLKEIIRDHEINVGMAIGGDTVDIEKMIKGNLAILVMTIATGKMGHNLEIAKTAIYMDRTFSPDDFLQSQARITRLTLAHKPSMYIIKAANSFDQIIDLNLSGKIEGIANITNSDLIRLLKGIKNG